MECEASETKACGTGMQTMDAADMRTTGMRMTGMSATGASESARSATSEMREASPLQLGIEGV